MGSQCRLSSVKITYAPTHSLTYYATNGSIAGVVYNTSTAVASGASVAEGGKVTLTAQPADGYVFSSWSDGGDNSTLSSTTDNPTTFTMGTANVTVTANFVASGATPTYTVTYSANGGMGAMTDENSPYEEGDEVTLLANTFTAPAGYGFNGWAVKDATNADVTVTNGKFSMPASNVTVTAQWQAYTITEQSNNESYGTVSREGNVITGHPADGYRYASPAYTVNPANSATVEQNGNEFTVTPTANTTVTINYEAIPTHTATFSVNGNNVNTDVVAEGASITFPSDPDAIGGKSFVGWATATISGTTNTAPTLVTSATMGNSDVTYYAVFADVTPGTQTILTDELTTSTFGSPSSYGNWTGKQATNGSSAVYAGNSTTYNSSAIQIRTTNTNSGIVTTATGGKATKVTVTWNSGTADNRTLDVYGKSSAYTTASDLYSASTQGSHLGSLYYKVEINNETITTTELTIDGDYQFIGLRSNSNAMYLDEIDIQWTSGTPDTYSNYCTSVVVLSASNLAITSSSPVPLEITSANVSPTNTITYTTSSTGTMNFVSDNTSVATVTSEGVITAVGAGTAKITISQEADASYQASDNIEVTVNVTDSRDACATGIDLPTAQKTLTKGDLNNFAATSTPAAGFTGSITYTYETSDADIVAVATGTYSAEAFGTADITITATPTGGNAANYKPASQIVTVTVNGTNSISLDPTSKTVAFSASTFDIAATVPTDNYNGTVSAESDNTSVATVSVDGTTVTVTPVAVGSAKITVTAGTDTYYPVTASAECNVTVTAPVGSTTAPSSEVVVFNETFAGCKSTGGNDDDGWNGTIASGTLSDGTSTDSSGWDFTTGNAANGCAKFGSGKAGGSATTPELTLEDGVVYTLTFKAAAWNGTSEGTKLALSAVNATLTDDESVAVDTVTTVKGKWSTYTVYVQVKDESDPATITFSTGGGNNRFFLDDVKVTTEGPAPTATVTLNKYGYATYCSMNPIDFSSTEGYTAWRVSDIASDGTITFTKITEKIKGGQGVLLYNKDADGVNTSDVTINFADGTTEFASSENLFVGTTAPFYLSEVGQVYGLSGNKFVKNSAVGNIGANKAYILAASIPNEVKTFNFVFEDDADAINEVENGKLKVESSIYNLAGQRLNKMQKGINIVNGKKVLF